jgi:hypothetical protein
MPTFTNDWFAGQKPKWNEIFKNLGTHKFQSCLEIGSYEGQSTLGMLNMFPECTVTLAEEWVDVPNRHPGQPPTRVLKSGVKIDWS